MLSGLVSNVISSSLLKSALSESCSKFSSKAHPQAATQLQLMGLSSEAWQVTAQLLLEAIKGSSHAEPSWGKLSSGQRLTEKNVF